MSFDLQSVALSLTDLNEAAEKDSTDKKSYKDDRFWKPTIDDAGNGFAVIRFLPPPAGENLPWAKYWDYGFQGPTGLWYFKKSLQTLGQTDPVMEYNASLWADKSGTQADIEARQNDVRKRKRRLNYVFNILVVNDPKNPDNNGKVFLYRTGKTIFDMIKKAMNPEIPEGISAEDWDEKGIPVFDFLEGANFKVKIFTKNKFVKYDDSGFMAPSALLEGDEDKLKEVYESLHSLEEINSADKFGSYDELMTPRS